MQTHSTLRSARRQGSCLTVLTCLVTVLSLSNASQAQPSTTAAKARKPAASAGVANDSATIERGRQAAVVDLAARLELGATNAYLGVIPAFISKDLSKIVARLAADETMHFTILTNALGRPLPTGALSFGA